MSMVLTRYLKGLLAGKTETRILHDKQAAESNITEKHIDAFEAILDPERRKEFALYSCFVDGHPTTAIVHMTDDPNEDNPERVRVAPVFMAVTADMKITNHQGVEAELVEKEMVQ